MATNKPAAGKSNDDITCYQRVVVALVETIRLMEEIDAAIPAVRFRRQM